VDLTEQPGENIFGLLVASDELLLEELFNHVQNYLIEKQSIWIENNLALVLHIVFKLSSCKKLQDYCIESIFSDPQPLNTSKEFPSLDKDILYDLLKRDDLNIEEIIAWDYLIKWGIEQTPGLGIKKRDRTKWNNKNYEALKKTLNEFIPLIRFTAISSADFFDKVRPYKVVIPCHIYEEVMEFYMKNTLSNKSIILPPRVGIQIESKIIKRRHAFIITNWIEKKEANSIRNEKGSLRKFNLIYRGSRDGIDDQSFKYRCNIEDPILVLIKCQNSRKIFGGYTPIGFYSEYSESEYSEGEYNEEFTYSEDSFIFSFEENNIELSRVKSYEHAVYNSNDYAFNFGDHDLYMQNQNLWIEHSGYYEGNLSGDNYVIDEIEAFRVEQTII
jgi:hypothetical protein